MDPAEDEDVIFTGHPSWRGVLSFYVAAAGVALLLGAIAAGITALLGTLSWVIVVLVVAVVLGLAMLAGFVMRQTTTYTITDQRLSIRRGLLAKKVQQTHVERVQNVNPSRARSTACSTSARSTSTPRATTTRSSPSWASPTPRRSSRPSTRPRARRAGAARRRTPSAGCSPQLSRASPTSVAMVRTT